MEGNTNSSPCREQTRFACNKIIDSSLRSLYQIWDKMGIDNIQKKARGDTAIAHVNNLMQHMIAEEETLMNQLAKTIGEFTEQLNQLCNELSLPHIKLSGGLNMVQQEKILHSKVETITKEKKDRMMKYDNLHGRDQQLCAILSTEPYHIPTKKVPTLEQLRDLEKHVALVQDLKDKRFAEFVMNRKQIVELLSSLECEPDTSFGCELMCEDDDSFGLSTENMEKIKQLCEELTKKDKEMKAEADKLWEHLRALWNRLKTSDSEREMFEIKMKGHGTKVISALKSEIETNELLKFQNICKFVDGVRSDLNSWWDKCYFSKEQRATFEAFNKEECTDELLYSHEKELEKVQQYYNTHKGILEKIAHREELFKNMIVFEEQASDPNRFFSDRGGKLLKEEKARKKLTKELPKIEEEVTEVIQKWEQDNNQDFLVNGVKFPEYVKNEWENFQLHKEEQKQSRLKARAKQTQNEMMYGSKSVSQTSNKRRLPQVATPVKTPLKTRKVEMTPTVSVRVKIQYNGLDALTSDVQPAAIDKNVHSSALMNDLTKTPSTPGKLSNNRYHLSTVTNTPSTKQPSSTQKTPINKSRKRSLKFKNRTSAKRSANNRGHQKSNTPKINSSVNDDSHSSSLASHGTYNDFAAGLTEADCHSSVVSFR